MKKIWNTSKFYLAAFSIPYILLLLLHFYFQSGHGNPIIGVLHPFNLLFNGFASVSFLFYLKHTPSLPFQDILDKNGYQLLFAIAYGMSSYALVQENNLTLLLSYCIFPIVFLSFEYMIHKERYFYFILLEAVAFIISPNCGAFLFFFFLILTFFELGIQHKLIFSTFIHCLSCMLLAFLLAAFRFFSYFEAADFSFTVFNISYLPDMILSRFLPGSIASIAYAAHCGTDIYFGLLFLIPLCFFFISKNISSGKRLCYGCFSLFLLLAIYVSPIRDFFHMGITVSGYSVPYSFLIVFWFLKLSYEAWTHIDSTDKKAFYGSILLVSLWITISYLRYTNNVITFVIPFTIILFLLYSILLYARLRTRNGSKPTYILLFFLVLCELTTSAWLCTDINCFSTKRSLYPTTFASREVDDTATTNSSAVVSVDSTESYTDENIIELLNMLDTQVNISTDEYFELCGTQLPNFFERYNALATKAGLAENLFQKASVDILWGSADTYQIVQQSDTLFHFKEYQSMIPYTYTIPFQLTATGEIEGKVCMYNELSQDLFCFVPENFKTTVNGNFSFEKIDSGTLNFEILFYTLNEGAAEQLTSLLSTYTPEVISEEASFSFTYWGIGLSCVGLFLFFCLFFNSDKEKVYKVLLDTKSSIGDWKIPTKIATHIKKNYVYYIAFFVPFITFVVGMVMSYCIPFGNRSFFDEDGLQLTLPSYLDCFYNLKEGNTYLSMNGGYGFNQYANHPLIQLLSFWKYLDADQIAPFLLFAEAICLGLCSFGMVFYLTHRLQDKAANKKDYLLLIPAFIYSMNAYMLAMHNFTGWYYTLVALPLLLCGMEYLLYKKKTLPYVLLLSFCMISNLYLALYICIFLVIYFFTCRFDNIADLFKKGFRFGCCSLLAAGNSFFIISNTLLSSSDSPYLEEDSVFPTLGLHTSFLEQWKKHMIFCKAKSVSSDDGLLNIYCGIFALFLVVLYFTSKKVNLKDKLRKLIPIVLLYVSFNEQVLSYIWNGFHYQSMVPNRYAFLLLFLIGVISYDALKELKEVSAKKMLLVTVFLIAFFAVCQFCSSGNSTLSWIATFILCIIYFVLHFRYRNATKQYYKVITCVFIAELCINSVYTMLYYNHTAIQLYGDYVETAEYIGEQTTLSTTSNRTIFPSSLLINNGQIFNAETNELFNSFVTQHQNKLNTIYGFHSGTQNYIRSLNSSTPFGLSLSGTRFIFVPTHANGPVEDLDYYDYLGKLDIHYVFENPYALSYGVYIPDAVESLEYDIFPPMFYNKLASLYTDSENEVFVSQYISYSEDINASDSFYLTDYDGNIISYEEALAYSKNYTTDNFSNNLLLHINYTPKKDGHVYLFTHELISLGQAKAGEKVTKTICFSDQILYFREDYNLVTINDENMENVLSIMSENQWENVKTENNCITGTTNYKEDGYTMFSIAWDKNWHAYIDGEEVEIEDFYDAMMFVKTPAGKHTLTLEYVPYGMKESKLVTLCFWIFTIGIYSVSYFIKRRKQKPAQDNTQ